jgi:glycosyltransferase involved in cell wall biosynthesis
MGRTLNMVHDRSHAMQETDPKLLFFQYGDFGDVYRKLQEGAPETYRDQRVSVDFVASFKDQYEVTTIAICDRKHDEDLGSRLRSIGIDENCAQSWKSLSRLFNDIAPDLIVCRTPNYHAIRWAKRRHVPTLLTFADFFANRTPKQFLRNIALRKCLTARVFPCVANHSLNASNSVSKALFYSRSRVVPWDWRPLRAEAMTKTAPIDPKRPIIFFAGLLTEAKGVGDCLEAAALLRKQGIRVSFVFAGSGDIDSRQSRARALGIGAQIEFLGSISNFEVRRRMARSDIVVIPSRHDCHEGLPNVIYEALASRTPTIISDHQAFANRLRHGETCLVFRAADPASLADRMATALRDATLYSRLSAKSAQAHDALYVGMEWTDLVSKFLGDPENRTGWVEANSLAQLSTIFSNSGNIDGVIKPRC